MQAVEQKAIDYAVEKGVVALRNMQQLDGNWFHPKGGATALAGLTLLECGADKKDKAVQTAAANVRTAALTMTHTYSLALSVLFLDRLDEKEDTPLIESLLVRLLAGQQVQGDWHYECPGPAAVEVRRLKEAIDGARVLQGGRDLSKLPAKGKRKVEDLPKEIQDQLKAIAQGKLRSVPVRGDNSNTQFAMLALWVGRRYGVPSQGALCAWIFIFAASSGVTAGGPTGPIPGMYRPRQ